MDTKKAIETLYANDRGLVGEHDMVKDATVFMNDVIIDTINGVCCVNCAADQLIDGGINDVPEYDLLKDFVEAFTFERCTHIPHGVVVFDNGGGVSLLLNDDTWCHHFANPVDAGLCYLDWIRCGFDSTGFDGHDDDVTFTFNYKDYILGAYRCYESNRLNDSQLHTMLESSGYGESAFARTLLNIKSNIKSR